MSGLSMCEEEDRAVRAARRAPLGRRCCCEAGAALCASPRVETASEGGRREANRGYYR